jgi:hypothetical protein
VLLIIATLSIEAGLPNEEISYMIKVFYCIGLGDDDDETVTYEKMLLALAKHFIFYIPRLSVASTFIRMTLG